jgi:hypothetical protein
MNKTSSIMNKSSSLPELKLTKKQKRKEQRKITRTMVRRLYTCEIKKIKQKNNSFMHKKPEDYSLDKQVKKLQKRRLLPIQSNSCFFLPKVERPEITNLCKLQENMRQAIYIPRFHEKNEDFEWRTRRIIRNDQKEDSDTFLMSENEEEFNNSILKYREELNFVKTRIKVIMTTLPKLRENLEMWPMESTHFNNISKKIEKLVTLLKTYENMEEKLKGAVKACENTLDARQNRLLFF